MSLPPIGGFCGCSNLSCDETSLPIGGFCGCSKRSCEETSLPPPIGGFSLDDSEDVLGDVSGV